VALIYYGEGYLLVAGGYTGGTTITSTVYLYNSTMQTWTQIASMPTSRYAHGAALGLHPNGDLGVIVLGGLKSFWTGAGTVPYDEATTGYSYSIRTNTWISIGTIPTTGKHGAWGMVAGFEGRIFHVGGEMKTYDTGAGAFKVDYADLNEAYVSGVHLFTARRPGVACARSWGEDTLRLANLTTGQTGSAVAMRAGDSIGVHVVGGFVTKTVAAEIEG
jgi:hypothetical protein